MEGEPRGVCWTQNGNSILGTKRKFDNVNKINDNVTKMIGVIFDKVSTDIGLFLRSTGLEQYQQSLSLVGVVSLENLTSLTHGELDQ